MRSLDTKIRGRALNLFRESASSPIVQLLLMVAAASVALLMRINDLNFITESLWNEDGTVFINQSYALGIKSLWAPQGGYLFLYHRLVAMLARAFPLVATPYIFFSAWVLSFFSIIWVLQMRGKSVGLAPFSTLCLVLAIALQPSQGEAFFNLNHANFYLGIALSFHVCIPEKDRASPSEVVFLVLASLTGAFSAFLLVVLAIQWIVLRDFWQRRVTYSVVAVCGVVQAIFIYFSGRVVGTGISLDVEPWVRNTVSLLEFGSRGMWAYIEAFLFWSATLISFISWRRRREYGSDPVLWLSPIFAVATAGLMFIVGGLAGRLGPISPLDMGSRYFLIPYSMMFFVSMAFAMPRPAARFMVLCLIGLICTSTFAPVDRPNRGSSTGLLGHANMQWVAFTKFQKVKPDLIIPINSPWPIDPLVWNVQITTVSDGGSYSNARVSPISLKPIRVISTTSTQNFTDADSSGESVGESPVLYFDLRGKCVGRRYIALEFDVWRSRAGFATVSWGRANDFDDSRSLERFYRAGSIHMQFAFRREVGDNLLRFKVAQGVPDSAIARFFVARKWASSPMVTVAEPMDAGGNWRLNVARLFCLK